MDSYSFFTHGCIYICQICDLMKHGIMLTVVFLSLFSALERLKAMVRQRDLGISSSSSTNNAAEVLRPEVGFASPCEVSSPDDGKV